MQLAENFDPHRFLENLLVVILSITVHEFAHALAADRIGDDTPRRQGRLTLLPTEHFDPMGFLMILITSLGVRGIGWGKPVDRKSTRLNSSHIPLSRMP